MIDPRSDTILTSRATSQALEIAEGLRFAALEEVISLMGGLTLPGDLTRHFVDLLSEKAEKQLRSAADNLASEALSLGRLDEAMVFQADIAAATYTALLDDNTCGACAEADGTMTELGSPEYERLSPPYQDCEGGNRCRCQFVFTLKTEAPPFPINSP